MSAEPLTPQEAVETVLQVHDAMATLIREDGLPQEAVEPAAGFLAALRGLGFEVVPVAQAPERVRAAILAAVRAAIDEVELSPHHAIGDPWATGYREGWVAARQAVEHA